MDSSKKILIIEDNVNIIKFYTRMLENSEFQFFEARNGKEGIKLAMEILPDLIILDYLIPEIDGLEVLKKIKAAQPEIPVIIITGNITHELSVDFLENGAFQYLVKPFPSEELEFLVYKALNNKKH